MGAPSYLIKKQDTYYFRQAWPRSIQSKIGKREVIKSLGVKEKSLAVRIAREFKVDLDDIVDQITSKPLKNSQVAVDILNNSLKRIKIKYKQIRAENENVSEQPQVPVLLPIPPQVSVISTNNLQDIKKNSKTKINPLFEKYSSEKTRLNQWSSKSLGERCNNFSLIVDLLKHIKKVTEIYIEDIKIEDVRELKELLLILPKNHNKKFPNLSLKVLINRCKMVEKENHDGMSANDILKIKEKISLNTITDKYVSTIKGFWKWLIDQEYIDKDIFLALKFDFKKTVNSWKTFTTHDLNKLFNDKIFNESDYEYSYQYFSPILALYTSCRLQEICQLRIKDIVKIDGIYVIKISGDNENSLKTANSERTIPIHSDLISLGFIEYVNKLRHNNEKYLFPELKNEDNTTKSKRVSKWFNERYRIRKGVEKGTSFHSFRRTFINEMSRNGASDSQIREIIGHKPERSDTLNIHYKDTMLVQEKFKLINQCIKYDTCVFPWRRMKAKK